MPGPAETAHAFTYLSTSWARSSPNIIKQRRKTPAAINTQGVEDVCPPRRALVSFRYCGQIKENSVGSAEGAWVETAGSGVTVPLAGDCHTTGLA